jgi:hypothetical protein
MLYIAKGITFLISKATPSSSAGRSRSSVPLNRSAPPGACLFIILAVIAHIVLSKTSFGRKLYVVGGNQEVARLAGISPALIQMTGFVLVGCLASWADAARVTHRYRKPDHWLGWSERHRRRVIGGSAVRRLRLDPRRRAGFAIMQVVTGLRITGVDSLLADRRGRRDHDHSGNRHPAPQVKLQPHSIFLHDYFTQNVRNDLKGGGRNPTLSGIYPICVVDDMVRSAFDEK